MLVVYKFTCGDSQQHPACRGEALRERSLETSTRDQSILAMVCTTSDKIDFKILCNYGVALIYLRKGDLAVLRNLSEFQVANRSWNDCYAIAACRSKKEGQIYDSLTVSLFKKFATLWQGH